MKTDRNPLSSASPVEGGHIRYPLHKFYMTCVPPARRVSAFILFAALLGALFPLYFHLSDPDPVAAQQPPTKLTVSGPASVSEAAGSVNVTVTLNRPAPAGGVTVTLRAGGQATRGSDPDLGADYTLPPPFTIPQGESTATASITILDDLADEPDEYFTVSATTNVAGITNTVYAQIYILDNDEPAPTVLQPNTLWSATLNVYADDPRSGTIVGKSGAFIYAGESYDIESVSNPGSIEGVNAIHGGLQVVIVPAPPTSFDTSNLTFVTGDRKWRIAEAGKYERLTNSYNGSTRYIISWSATKRLWNRGDKVALSLIDNYIYTIQDTSAGEGENAQATIHLPNKAPLGGLRFSVTPGYVTATSTDVGDIPQSVLVSAGLKSRTFSIPILRDSEKESDETFTLTVAPSGPNASRWKPAESGADTATVTITDTTEQVTFYQKTAFDAPEATSTQILLFRSGPVDRPLTVQVELKPGTAGADDYSADSANQAVTFFEGFYAAYGVFVFTPTDDMIDEDDETVTASIIPPPGYIATSTATITILDDDTAIQQDGSDATLSFGSATISDKVYTAGGQVDDPGLPLAQVEGGVIQVDYTATGLPAGLELTPDRAIRGAPAEPTNTPATVTYTATGSNGSSASLTFEVTVMPPVELSETNIATVVYTIGQAKPLNVVLPEASGGEAPLTYHLLRNRIVRLVSPMEIRNGEVKSLSDSAIFGAGAVAFDSSTRAITGAPQRANRAALSYYAIDANGAFAHTNFDMRVVNPPRFKTIADKTYAIGETVNEKLPKPAGGAIYNNYSRTQYELTPLPKGLSFGVSNRKITGTVTAETAARTTVAYTVTDRNGVSASTTFDIIVPGGATTPTDAPTLTAYTSSDNKVVALNWENIEGATGYVIQVKAAEDDWPVASEDSLPPGARIHNIAPKGVHIGSGWTARALVLGLTEGEEYVIRAAAANEDGIGPFSEAVTAALTAPPPAAPQITASAWGNTLNLDWPDVPGATGYIVQVKAADAAWPTEAKQSLPSGASTLKNHKLGRMLVLGLTMGNSYQARMAAVNDVGAGEFSTVWNFVLGVSATEDQ